jgi:RNA polymerase sigma-70 factor (ECF subfamily)
MAPHRSPDAVHYRRLSDEALAARLGRRDERALAEFYVRHAASAHRLARRIVRDSGLAEDAVQEALLSAWGSATKFAPGRGGARSWFLTIVHHRAVDIVRAREGKQLDELPQAPDRPGPDPVDVTIDRDEVRDALLSLPENFREPLALTYYGGLSQRQCAELLSEPLGTVKSRMFRGLACLRERLAEFEPA